MDVAVAEELRLGHAATTVEALLGQPGPDVRATNAEAFQRVLWRHRDAIIRLIDDFDRVCDDRDLARVALALFARCASVLAPGQNPVLLSLPSPADGGRTFVQLRPEDFRRAAALVGVCL